MFNLARGRLAVFSRNFGPLVKNLLRPVWSLAHQSKRDYKDGVSISMDKVVKMAIIYAYVSKLRVGEEPKSANAPHRARLIRGEGGNLRCQPFDIVGTIDT